MRGALQDIRFALRQAASRPLFAALVVGVMALGIGATTAIFSLTDVVLFRSLPVAEPERVMRIFRVDESGRPAGSMNFPAYADLRDHATGFSHVAAYVGWASFNLGVSGQEPVRIVGGVATGEFFELLGVSPLLGRYLLPSDDIDRGAHPVLVIGEQVWRRHFNADPDVVGTEVRINTHPFTVVGVMPARFGGLSASGYVDAWAPMAMLEQAHPGQSWEGLSQRGWTWHDAIARLAPGVSLEQAQAEVDAIVAGAVEEFGINPNYARLGLIPADTAAVDVYGSQGTRRNAWLLLGVTVTLLLIAMSNTASLLLVRTEERAREIALRLGIGATRGRVLRMLFSEALLYALVGTALGLLMAWLVMSAALPQLRTVLGAGPTDPVLLLHGRVFAFAAVLAVLTASFAVLSPVLRVFRIDLNTALKQGAVRGPRQGAHARNAMVVGQVMLSVGLLAVALLLVRSFWHTAVIDPGFDPRDTLVAAIDFLPAGHSEEEAARMQQDLLARLDAHPAVESATFTGTVPMQSWSMVSSFTRPGMDEGAGGHTEFQMVTPDFFDTLRIPLLQGRVFEAGDREGAPLVMVVNRAFAERFMPGEDPLGQRIEMSSREWHIIGVVGDIKLGNLREEFKPVVWMPLAQRPNAMASIVLRSHGADPWTLLPVLREAVHALDPALPILRPRTMVQQIGESYRQATVMAWLLSAFAVLAVVLSAAGLYGMLAWQVRTHTREIGIRIAIGASAAAVRRQFLRRGLLLTAIGIPFGLLVAVWVGRAMDALLYGVAAHDPLTLAGVAGGFLLLALLATWGPARHSTRIDPMTALREE